MTPQERLKLYEIALKDYEAASMIEIRANGFTHGLCRYFYLIHGLDVYNKMHLTFPEIHKSKPVNSGAWYFDFGDIKSRIELLKKAIELTKKKIT